ncbi:hypothetical protein ABZ924_25845 [Streptomyces sp. NPDC046876]|uniref:hypothetical protein n=1 Tax=Streptomyces sp. NPDC046876 TaxID=3155616 RepID=UPI003405A229
MRGAAVELLVWWAVLTGMTVVSISSPDPVELLVAAAVAAAAAVVARQTRRAAGVGVRGWAGAPRACAALPVAAVRGLGVLLAALARPRTRTARTRRVRLRTGADPGWAGAALGWSADTCVVDLPEGTREAVVHTLASHPAAPERAVTDRGGAR